MTDDPMAKYVEGLPPELQDIFRKWSDTIAENERLRRDLIVWKGIAAGHEACYQRLKAAVVEVTAFENEGETHDDGA